MRHALWLVLIGCTATPPTAVPTAAELPAALAPPRTWRPLVNQPTFDAGTPQLMTDGTVFVQQVGVNAWWKLTPDAFGEYDNGTWTRLADAPLVDNDDPSGSPPQVPYGPLYYASATLPDGRIIIMGGEYVNFNPVWTKAGAIYDPVADQWKVMAPPVGWQTIGDASSIVLADGTFMLSSCCEPAAASLALLDPVTLKWRPTGTGKADIHDEEAWAMLPDGRVLTVDAENPVDAKYSEIYDPATGKWTAAGDVPVFLADNPAAGGSSYEVGPEILRPDGTVVALGGTPHNAVYDTKTSTWSALPDTPQTHDQSHGNRPPLDVADGPAALLPNGDILFASSPGIFEAPVRMYELHGSTFVKVTDPPPSASDTSYEHVLLVLPTGEILHTGQNADIELYTPGSGIVDIAQPVILGAPELVSGGPVAQTAPIATLYRDRIYTITVQRMNGVSQGAYYGDDVQTSTNFPIVRVSNSTTGHVVYCRTHEHSDRSIAPDERGTTKFDVPDTMEPGLAQLSVIANGIASPPIDVNVK